MLESRLSKSARAGPEFASKLHDMITTESHLIRFGDGKIEIVNPTRLASEVLPRHFRHGKFSSLQRQLNNFGFKKIQGKGKMAPCTYLREDLRGQSVDAIQYIRRKPAAGEVSSAQAPIQSASSPSAYLYEPVSHSTSALAVSSRGRAFAGIGRVAEVSALDGASASKRRRIGAKKVGVVEAYDTTANRVHPCADVAAARPLASVALKPPDSSVALKPPGSSIALAPGRRVFGKTLLGGGMVGASIFGRTFGSEVNPPAALLTAGQASAAALAAVSTAAPLPQHSGAGLVRSASAADAAALACGGSADLAYPPGLDSLSPDLNFSPMLSPNGELRDFSPPPLVWQAASMTSVGAYSSGSAPEKTIARLTALAMPHGLSSSA